MEMKTIYRGRRLYIGRGQRLESILSIYNLSTVSLMKSKKKKVYSSWISLPPRLNGHQFRLRPRPLLLTCQMERVHQTVILFAFWNGKELGENAPTRSQGRICIY